jgi:hypothetical protein
MAKTYARGSSKEHVFNNGSAVINFSLNYENLGELVDEKGWIQLTMAPRKEVDPYGNTHVVYLNEFKPDASKKVEAAKSTPDKDEDGDLPF